MNRDKIYFYADDGTKFNSKIAAVEYALKMQQEVKFYFYDDVYSKVDWKKELPHELNYYYKQQALRLRDKFDYLILAYSGGSDSTNILETFVYNDIKLDKIISVGAFSKDPFWGSDENHNGEIYHNVIPCIKKMGLENITEIIDYTKYLDDENFKNLSVFSLGKNWVYDIGAFFSVHNFFWRDAEKIIVPKEWKNKKVGLILGSDKPILHKISDKRFISFSDACVTQYGNSLGFENTERVAFYWDPEFTDVIVKQTQELKKRNCFTVNQKEISEIIYNLRNPLSFESPKSGNHFWSLRDTYLKHMKNTELFKFYNEGLKIVEEKIGFERVPVLQTMFFGI